MADRGATSSSAALVWQAVCQEVNRRYPMATVNEREIRLVLVVGGDVRVGIRVAPFGSDDAETVQIAADLGPAVNAEPWDALQFNALLPYGGLAVINGVLVLRDVVDCTHFDDQTFDRQLVRLAITGAEIKRRLGMGTTRRDPRTYQHYCE